MACFGQFSDDRFFEHRILAANENGAEQGGQILQHIGNPVTAGQACGLQNLGRDLLPSGIFRSSPMTEGSSNSMSVLMTSLLTCQSAC